MLRREQNWQGIGNVVRIAQGDGDGLGLALQFLLDVEIYAPCKRVIIFLSCEICGLVSK